MSKSEGENLMYAAIHNNILENIAQNYVNIYKNHSVEKIQLQTSVLSVECGEWCEDCLKLFIDLEKLEANESMTVEDKKKTIQYIRRSVCRGACVCTVNKLDMTNDVVFITDSTIVDEVDVDIITEKLNVYLSEQYKNQDFKEAADKNKVSQIINDININLSSNISQSVATFQTVKIEGAGSIKNVSMEVMVRAVMVTMLRNKATVESISEFAQAIFEKIAQEVQKSFKDELKAMMKKYKTQLIVMFSLFGLAFLIQVILVFYQVYAVTK